MSTEDKDIFSSNIAELVCVLQVAGDGTELCLLHPLQGTVDKRVDRSKKLTDCWGNPLIVVIVVRINTSEINLLGITLAHFRNEVKSAMSLRRPQLWFAAVMKG